MRCRVRGVRVPTVLLSTGVFAGVSARFQERDRFFSAPPRFDDDASRIYAARAFSCRPRRRRRQRLRQQQQQQQHANDVSATTSVGAAMKCCRCRSLRCRKASRASLAGLGSDLRASQPPLPVASCSSCGAGARRKGKEGILFLLLIHSHYNHSLWPPPICLFASKWRSA